MGSFLFFLVIAVLAVLALGMLRGKIARSPSTVVTGPGVIKIHNVEAKFRRDGSYFGKLSQDRWSDGQERFSLWLRNLPAGEGAIDLYRGQDLVSQFERSGTKFEFRWKGMSSKDMPAFAIGDEVRIETADFAISAIVEAD